MAVAAAASNELRSELPLSQQFPALTEYIASQARLQFRNILSSHVRKSKKAGGPICQEHLSNLITQDQIEVVGGNKFETKVTLILPNSFDFGDGVACGTSVCGKASEAEEEVCKKLMVELFLRDAAHYPNSKLVLHQNNWKCPLGDLLTHVYTISQQPVAPESIGDALPLPLPLARRRQAVALYEPPVDKAVRYEECVAFLQRVVVENEGGSAAPSRLRTIQMADGEQRSTWRELARLFEPGKLKQFVKDPANPFGGDFTPDGQLTRVYARQGPTPPAAALPQPTRSRVQAPPAGSPLVAPIGVTPQLAATGAATSPQSFYSGKSKAQSAGNTRTLSSPSASGDPVSNVVTTEDPQACPSSVGNVRSASIPAASGDLGSSVDGDMDSDEFRWLDVARA